MRYSRAASLASRPFLSQDKEIKYRRYNALLDRDLCDGVAKSGAKRQEQDEKLRLDLERVAFHRKKVGLFVLGVHTQVKGFDNH